MKAMARGIFAIAFSLAVAASAGELLAHYTFERDTDTTVVDEQGNFAGIATGITYGPGRAGALCARFDGTNSFIRIPAASSVLNLAGTPYTVAFWMKGFGRNAQSSGVIFQEVLWMGSQVPVEPSPPRYLPAEGYGFNYGNGAAAWGHRNGSDSDLLIDMSTSNPRTIGNTNWIHFALVFDGSERRIYMNGNLSNSVATANALLPLGGYDVYIGSKDTNDVFYRGSLYHGSLDDLRIYNYALTPAEIASVASVDVSVALDIELNGDVIDVRWPIIDPSRQYGAQFKKTMDSSESWTSITNKPQRDGENLRLAYPATNSAVFFRLQKQ
jgi:hypothetical protein